MENQKLNTENDTFLAKWLADQLSDAELKNLVSDVDFRAYKKLKKGISVLEQLNASTDESFSKIQQHISGRKVKVRPLYKNWSIGIAASIVLLFGLFSIFGNNNIIIETSFGESKTIALLDGSEVVLNSKSRISYNKENWEDKRTLTLDGEAYFKVQKGETFTVKTDNGVVAVLGTQFNVKSTKDFFDVVCYEGKVGVKTLEKDYILRANDAVRKVNDDVPKPFEITDVKPTWINGESTFKSVPIRYVILALQDHYNITFNAENIDSAVLFSGSFPHNNLKVALKTVFEPLDITYFEKEKRNIILRY